MDDSSAESSLNASNLILSGASFDIEGQPTGCPKCASIILRYTDIFKSLVHQGTELKKKKG